MELPIYTPNRLHRNGNPNKSQWRISENEERICFNRMYNNNWHNYERGWGLHFNKNNAVDYLGVGTNRNKRLFLAKFVCANEEWHGYPVDHMISVSDIPDSRILRNWLNCRYLGQKKIRCISRGQRCNL